MTVEQVVDDYLKGVRQIVGTTTLPPGPAASPESDPPNLPDVDWTGNAHEAAVAASKALHKAQQQLTTATGDVAAVTESAALVAHDASAQLDTITGEWNQAKTAVATLPDPPARAAALMPQALQTIAEAVTLISATTAKYATAADEVRKHTAGLPKPSHEHPEHTGPTDAADGAPSASGMLSPPSALPDSGLEASSPAPSNIPAAAGDPLSGALPAAAGMMPAALGAAMPAMAAPASVMPAFTALPSAAAAPLGGMLSPLLQNSPAAPSDAADTPTTATTASHIGKPGTVTAAIEAALDAIGITDPEARQHWRDGYQVLIRRESTFDPHAINNSDTNATGPILSDGGHAGSSRGLTQVIPSTFRAYHVPGTSTDIFDPVANIAASMNYAMGRYHVSPSGMDLAQKIPQANPNSRGGGY
jgi:hypothetical protein